ncbi:cytochrome b-c1 complex subunit 9-like isoform X2 [Benincasa hispida]|nr:cytochrome b-c1 complex subunit 9-like isoform X2 [Benincasa hispida]
MDSAARRSGGGLLEGLYRVIMRRNSVYVTFIIAGAFVGERAVDYGVHKLWEYNNVGKRIQYKFDLTHPQPKIEEGAAVASSICLMNRQSCGSSM